MSTADAWERWANENPYYSVITNQKFLGKELTPEVKEEFYASGYADVENVLSMVRLKRKTRALEIGCGVGRMTAPLARTFEHVDAIDVSPTMLQMAESHCAGERISNVAFAEDWSNASNYDFILSYIVLQHVPVPEGVRLFRRALGCLDSKGCAVIHFTYKVPDHHNPEADPGEFPEMQMNPYPVEVLLGAAQELVTEVSLKFTNHGGYLGCFLVIN